MPGLPLEYIKTLRFSAVGRPSDDDISMDEYSVEAFAVVHPGGEPLRLEPSTVITVPAGQDVYGRTEAWIDAIDWEPEIVDVLRKQPGLVSYDVSDLGVREILIIES